MKETVESFGIIFSLAFIGVCILAFELIKPVAFPMNVGLTELPTMSASMPAISE
jgi:hypothetical protein